MIFIVVGDIPAGTEVAVIGGGPGGYVAAIRAAQLGKEVTVIEKDPQGLGGICLNHGCIPSKALIYAANQYEIAKKGTKFGLNCADVKMDNTKLQEWKEKSIEQLRGGIAGLFKKYNINLVNAEAKFVSSRKISITTEEKTGYVEYEKAILATGSSPTYLPGFEPDGNIVINSTHALKLKEVPKSMVVLGAGYIAIEMGMLYAKLGTKVSMIARSVLLSQLDRDIVAPVYTKMKELGMDLYEGATPERIQKGDMKSTVSINSKENGMTAIETQKVLVAVGRKPNTANLGLEKTQVQLNERGFVKVDSQRKTSDYHIYAIGDIIDGPMLAHKAFMDGKVAAEVICGLKSAFDTTIIPAVVFSDPEIAYAGLSEKEAKEQGYKLKIGKFPMNALGRAVSVSKSEGFVKVIADEKTERILGVHIVAANASDLISEGGLGLEMGMTLEDLALTIHPHPTFPEAIAEAAEAALGKAIHFYQMKKE